MNQRQKSKEKRGESLQLRARAWSADGDESPQNEEICRKKETREGEIERVDMCITKDQIAIERKKENRSDIVADEDQGRREYII